MFQLHYNYSVQKISNYNYNILVRIYIFTFSKTVGLDLMNTTLKKVSDPSKFLHAV